MCNIWPFLSSHTPLLSVFPATCLTRWDPTALYCKPVVFIHELTFFIGQWWRHTSMCGMRTGNSLVCLHSPTPRPCLRTFENLGLWLFGHISFDKGHFYREIKVSVVWLQISYRYILDTICLCFISTSSLLHYYEASFRVNHHLQSVLINDVHFVSIHICIIRQYSLCWQQFSIPCHTPLKLICQDFRVWNWRGL